MKGGTLFSGIGSPEVACPEIDWRWCAEIEPFACAVHAAHFPGVPNLGDVTKIDPAAVEPVDIVVFGSPCQSFSVAGKRLGLDDPRGNLALIALRLVAAIRPRWFLFENVPGLLSSDGGRDFGTFLAGVEQCGYGWSYRTLDAQYFGVPQRRRRLFVVGCLGDWRGAAAVLLERESLRGDPAPRREAGEGIAPAIAPCLEASGRGVERTGESRGQDPLVAAPLLADPLSAHEQRTYSHEGRNNFRLRNVVYDITGSPATTGAHLADVHTPLRANRAPGSGEDRTMTVVAAYGGNRQSGALEVASACNAHGGPHGRMDFESETFIVQNGASQHAVAFAENTRNEVRLCDISPQLTTGGGKPGQGYPAVAFEASVFESRYARNGRGAPEEVVPPLKAQSGQTGKGDSAPLLQTTMSVRRLTPRECERLQGLPEISQQVVIVVCQSESEKSDVLAEIHSHNERAFVSTAAESALRPDAASAANHLSTSLLDREWPVALNVLIDFERTAVAISRAGRSIWSASSAGAQGKYRLPVPIDDFVHLAARMTRVSALGTTTGKAASSMSASISSPRLNGSRFVIISGQEIEAAVGSATIAAAAVRFITSLHGSSSHNLEQILATSSCFVIAAINGFIPVPTLNNGSSFVVSLETRDGFTRINYRGKPAADGPRYRALGNAMAVPVVRWILERVKAQ